MNRLRFGGLSIMLATMCIALGINEKAEAQVMCKKGAVDGIYQQYTCSFNPKVDMKEKCFCMKMNLQKKSNILQCVLD